MPSEYNPRGDFGELKKKVDVAAALGFYIVVAILEETRPEGNPRCAFRSPAEEFVHPLPCSPNALPRSRGMKKNKSGGGSPSP